MTRPQSERYHDLCVRLPADKNAERVLLREIFVEGTSRGWKLISAVKEPGGNALLVTWDTSEAFSG